MKLEEKAGQAALNSRLPHSHLFLQNDVAREILILKKSMCISRWLSSSFLLLFA